MNSYRSLNIEGYEEVVRCDNPALGLTAWIAIHNSSRGPALGGCRVWNYRHEEQALEDVLRLARGMTYKNSLADLSLGGGKSVVMTDLSRVDRTALFEAVGQFVETLGGRYITAEDVNSTVADMVAVKRYTSHVATVGASGNPSPFTAYGVYCALKAAASSKLGTTSLAGLTVAIQGVGETGGRLAELLAADGCRIIACDISRDNLDQLRRKIDFIEVSPEAIYEQDCQVFSPCALGGTVNPESISRMRCAIVVGSANNQLLTAEDGQLLHARGILYIPDYAANAGGVINISCEIGQVYDAQAAKTKVARIGETVRQIIELSHKSNLPPCIVADQLAEERFALVKAA